MFLKSHLLKKKIFVIYLVKPNTLLVCMHSFWIDISNRGSNHYSFSFSLSLLLHSLSHMHAHKTTTHISLQTLFSNLLIFKVLLFLLSYFFHNDIFIIILFLWTRNLIKITKIYTHINNKGLFFSVSIFYPYWLHF